MRIYGTLGLYHRLQSCIPRLLQAGSSIQPQIPSESNVHAVFEIDPEILAHVFNAPLPNLENGGRFFLFSPDIWVYVFLGHLSLKGFHVSKKKKKKNVRKGLTGAY